jgi:hypothetical protein
MRAVGGGGNPVQDFQAASEWWHEGLSHATVLF